MGRIFKHNFLLLEEVQSFAMARASCLSLKTHMKQLSENRKKPWPWHVETLMYLWKADIISIGSLISPWTFLMKGPKQ